MKLITRDTDYAVRALCFIARQNGDIVSVATLVKELKTPRPFLRKILQILHRKGVLDSYKGQGGGFTLATTADKVSLVDLIRIFQGKGRPLQLNECIFKKKICPQRSVCVLRHRLTNIERNVFNELDNINIASLL